MLLVIRLTFIAMITIMSQLDLYAFIIQMKDNIYCLRLFVVLVVLKCCVVIGTVLHIHTSFDFHKC